MSEEPFHLRAIGGAIKAEYETDLWSPPPSPRCPASSSSDESEGESDGESDGDGEDADDEDLPRHKREIAAVLDRLADVAADEDVRREYARVHKHFAVDRRAVVRFQGPRVTVQSHNLLGFCSRRGTIPNFRITVEESALVPYVEGRVGEPAIMEMYWDLPESDPAAPVRGSGRWDCA